MPTVHIEAKKEDIAKIVIMPGDPLRAKWIAENYLKNYKLVNTYRNMLAYTGDYKDRKITIFASGMGIPSMGIYSYELFSEYGVEKIIRIGTCGSYKKDINVNDVVIVKEIISNSGYLELLDNKLKFSDLTLNDDIILSIVNIAKAKNIHLEIVKANCSEVFYSREKNNWQNMAKISDVVEMESLSLYANAKVWNKQAICLLTVSDSFVTGEALSAKDRQTRLINMIEIALEVK